MATLYQLKNVHEDKDAAYVDPRTGIWKIEPGDATHYEVFTSQDLLFARAEVGPMGDEYCGLLVSKLPDSTLMYVPFGRRPPNEYNYKVLKYFCELALELPCVEPDVLADRRKTN